MQNVEVLVNKDRRVTMQEVANQYSIGIGNDSAHKILNEKEQVWVSFRWVPKQSIEDQKASRVTIANEHLERFNHDKNTSILIGNELWVHYTKPETKAQSQQRKWVRSPPPKMFKLSSSAGKFMLVAFSDLCGIILAYFISKGRTVTTWYYP